jgi:hypothetical protein
VWGDNQFVAVQSPEAYTYYSVVVNRWTYCGLTTNYSIRCWSVGTTASTAVTDQSGNVIYDFMDVAIGTAQTCGIRSDASVWCWGSNNYGESGFAGSGTSYASPATTFTTNDAVSIATGGYFTCVLRKNSEVWCWGLNSSGQLGQSPFSVASSVPAYQIQNWTDVRAISTNCDAEHICAVRQDGGVNTLWCWGSNTYGELGAGANPSPGLTPTVTSSSTPANTPTASLTPSTSPPGGVTLSSTPANSPTSSQSSSFKPGYYQYVPQYVSIPVM